MPGWPEWTDTRCLRFIGFGLALLPADAAATLLPFAGPGLIALGLAMAAVILSAEHTAWEVAR